MTFSAAAVAGVAMAHNGATGVVLERMNGMVAMRDTMGALTPIMQGLAPYDADAVAAGGEAIAMHAGATMLALFPDGSAVGATYARPEIWSEWAEFARFAEALRDDGKALAAAAENGLKPAADMMAGMDHSRMAMPAPTARVFSVAELMGYGTSARAKGDPAVASADPVPVSTAEVFERIGATCSSCHARFRAGRS